MGICSYKLEVEVRSTYRKLPSKDKKSLVRVPRIMEGQLKLAHAMEMALN